VITTSSFHNYHGSLSNLIKEIIMNTQIDEVSEGLDAALDTVKSLVKVLVVAYNEEITKLLKESIEKSQTIEKLESGDRY
tara:strand:+ start:92 stop:331 length:240 start_codon:yes stop_codon:yes gene_type:complete